MWPNIAVLDHPLEGARVMFRPNLTAYDPAKDTESGTLVVAPQHEVEVVRVFHDWNNNPGLTILYVFNPATGLRTHLTPEDCGLSLLEDEEQV